MTIHEHNATLYGFRAHLYTYSAQVRTCHRCATVEAGYDDEENPIDPCGMTEDEREDFANGYIEAMVWANVMSPEGVERDYVEFAVTEAAREQMEDDCISFLTMEVNDTYLYDILPTLDRYSNNGFSYAGHDFALTRNHHGTGFWDRGLADHWGGTLSELAESFGEAHLYPSDDGEELHHD